MALVYLAVVYSQFVGSAWWLPSIIPICIQAPLAVFSGVWLSYRDSSRERANIKRADARPYVFGYTVLNDVTARDIQSGWGGQYFKGKSLDRSCPTGPWIVTSDEVPNPQALNLQLRLNGTVKQDGNTRDMIYAVDAIIEWVSKGMTLLPGSMIATGTPDGVGFARTPPQFLKPGDEMETEVEGIGLLRNKIVAAVNE